jgi:hypothetical protein
MHKAVAQANRPKSALQIACQQQGGEVAARGLNVLPRNVNQMKNFRRSGIKKDKNVLYSVMLQCKLAEGKSDAFVRDVKAAPQPQCVLFTDYQISDLVRFTTNAHIFSIFTADTTYNLGEFYVTPITYEHLMVQSCLTGKHPFLLGPILVHQCKDFIAFNYFISTLIAHERKLKNVKAFGTDGDPALIEALSHNFPDALQLRCSIHLKRNIAEKLKSRGISSSDIQEFLADIFGKQCGNTFQEGLIDSKNAVDFHHRLKACKVLWEERDAILDDAPSFFDYFNHHYATIISNTMLKDVRTAAGLGSPPSKFTTNASESLNAVIKRKVDYSETQWSLFNDRMKELVFEQRDEVIRAISGRGEYRLCKGYEYLQILPQEWAKMTPDQRKRHIKKFDAAALRIQTSHGSGSTQNETASTSCSLLSEPCCSNTPLSHSINEKYLSIPCEDSGIENLPFATLHSMWVKAEEY